MRIEARHVSHDVWTNEPSRKLPTASLIEALLWVPVTALAVQSVPGFESRVVMSAQHNLRLMLTMLYWCLF